MSEQKYDVFQVVDMIGTKRFQGVFTKSDLSKMMDGALYSPEKHFCKYVDYSFNCHTFGCVEEWINPLIELIPVEVTDD